MEIYYKDKDGKLQETTVYDLLDISFRKANFKMENGEWSDENHKWIGLVQESEDSCQITTNITFSNDGNTVKGLRIYSAPIKRVVDEDNSRQII